MKLLTNFPVLSQRHDFERCQVKIEPFYFKAESQKLEFNLPSFNLQSQAVDLKFKL